MDTPWGDVSVSDAHIHFFSHRFFSLLAAQKSASIDALGPLLGWEIPLPEPETLARRWLAEMDINHVDRAVMIASVPGDEASVLAAVNTAPDRFLGYAMVNPLAQDALQRTSQALNAGLRGICLFPAMHDYPIQDAAVEAVLVEVQKYPAVDIFVHCGVLTVGVRKKLGLSHVFGMKNANPLDLIPVAARHPELTFVVPHFGAGLFREALMLCDLCPNVVLDTASSNSWMRYEGLTLESVFRRALDVVGPTRLRFGSDSSFFPRGWHRGVLSQQIQAMSSIGLSAADVRAILGGNLPH